MKTKDHITVVSALANFKEDTTKKGMIDYEIKDTDKRSFWITTIFEERKIKNDAGVIEAVTIDVTDRITFTIDIDLSIKEGSSLKDLNLKWLKKKGFYLLYQKSKLCLDFYCDCEGEKHGYGNKHNRQSDEVVVKIELIKPLKELNALMHTYGRINGQAIENPYSFTLEERQFPKSNN